MTPAVRQLGRWSAWGMVVVSVIYVMTGGVGSWVASHRAGRASGPTDPYLAMLEILIIVSAPLMVLTMTAVHAYASRPWKPFSLAALCFTVLLAGTTGAIHFLRLTVVRRLTGKEGAALSSLVSFRWPSVAFALDLLAWDLFLGLALLLAAPVFQGTGLDGSVRRTMIVGGLLCVAGLLGPCLGDLRFQLLAIVGYAAVFPVVCLLLAILFGRTETSPVDEKEWEAGPRRA